MKIARRHLRGVRRGRIDARFARWNREHWSRAAETRYQIEIRKSIREEAKVWRCYECNTARTQDENGGVTWNGKEHYGKCVKCDDEWATFHR